MRGRHLLLLLVGAILLVTTIIATGLGLRTDREVAKDARTRELVETSRAVQSLSLDAAGRVEDVAGLVRTSSVDAGEFAAYTEPMLSGAGATTISWIRMIAARDRAAYEHRTGRAISVVDSTGRRIRAPSQTEYAVTTFVKTVADDRSRVGVNEAGDPVRALAMGRAAQTHSPQATIPVALDASGRLGFIIYVPVYAVGTAASLNAPLRGFAAAGFAFADGEGKLGPLLGTGTAMRITVGGQEAATIGTLRGPVGSASVLVAGQPWRVAVTTPAAPRQALGMSRAQGAFVACALLSLLLGTLMWQAMVGSKRAEELSELRQRERDDAISERERAEQTTSELLGHLPDLAVLRFDEELRVVTAKGGLLERAGWTAEELEGSLANEVFAGQDGAALREGMRRALDGEPSAFTSRGLRDSSRLFWMQTLPLPGEPKCGLVVTSDVSSLIHAESARDQAQARFERVFADAPVGMAIVSTKGKFVQANEAMATITGYSIDELTNGMGPANVTHPEDLAVTTSQVTGLLSGRTGGMNVEKRYLRKDGQVRWIALHTTTLPDADGKTEFILAHIIDVTDRHEFAEQLQHLADHDPLTELRNRRSFEQALQSQVALVQRYGPEGALLLLDLDHFKAVNDTAGHHAGDRILETVADILRTSLRASDVVGRLGGDEFAVMLPKADETEARIVAAKIGDRIRKQCAGISGSAGPPVTASIGVVVLDPLHATADQALMAADRAMYDAKASGRDGFAVAAPVGGAAPRGS